jgi:serine/threonine protein kinase
LDALTTSFCWYALLQVQADLLLGLLQLDLSNCHEGLMQVRGATYLPDGTITVYCEDCGSMTIIDYMRSMFPQDMEEHNPHRVRLAVQLMLQASEAMSFADSKLGCLMRDCKPDDILVTSSGQVKHIDPTLVPLDSRDNLYGTPGYGAPEVMVQLFASKLAGHYFDDLPDADTLAAAVLNDVEGTSPAYKALAKYCNLVKGHLLTSKAGTYSMGSILFELCLPGLAAAEAGRAKELLETHEQLQFVASICEEDATSLAGMAMSWERDVVVQPQLIRSSALVDALQEALVVSMKVDPEERMSLEEFMACLRTAIRQLDQQIAALERSKQTEQEHEGGEEEEESKQQEVAAAVASCEEVLLAEPQLLSTAGAAAGVGCKHDTKAATIAACVYCAPEEVGQVQQRGFSDSAAGAAHTTCDNHNSSSSLAICSKPIKQEEQQQDNEGVVGGTDDSFTRSSTPSSSQVLAKGMQLLLAPMDLITSSSSCICLLLLLLPCSLLLLLSRPKHYSGAHHKQHHHQQQPQWVQPGSLSTLVWPCAPL